MVNFAAEACRFSLTSSRGKQICLPSGCSIRWALKMTAAGKIEIPEQQIAAFCQRWKITELALFGSVLREDFGPESDVDVLVTFAPGAGWDILDHIEMEEEMAVLLGRSVDLVNRRAIEQSRNRFRRREILESAESIYVS